MQLSRMRLLGAASGAPFRSAALRNPVASPACLAVRQSAVSQRRANSSKVAAVDERNGGASDANVNERFGTPSPWAFDPWDAITADTTMVTSEEEKALLEASSVTIPMSRTEEGGLPSVTSILGAYEATLQQRSALHLGYPYNLDYHNDDLARFMRYSINNLGDPFVPSNYGVHSRQFEVAVVDFFAKLWKAPEDDY